MKRYLISLLTMSLLSGCQWIVMHPAEDAEIVKVAEEAAMDFYNYETGTLSPTPPQPNAKPQGPTGPLTIPGAQ